MMEKKNNKRRRELLFLWLLLTSMLLTTTSYAWFTANRVVEIDTLNLHVQASGGIEISSDATNWKNILTNEDIKNARDNYPTSRNQLPYLFEPVSTGGTVDNNGLLKMYYGNTQKITAEDFILTSKRIMETESFGTDSTGKYVSFDVFFKTSNAVTLYLTNKSKVLYVSDNKDYSGIENAIRGAFLEEGNTSSTSSIYTMQNMNGATKAYIWEPNYDVHTQYGLENALNIYGITTSMANAAALSYDGVIEEIPENQNIALGNASANNYPAYFKKVNVDASTKKDFTESREIISLKEGVTKVRIYIWIEGQDVDCENNASTGDVTVDLELTTNPG